MGATSNTNAEKLGGCQERKTEAEKIDGTMTLRTATATYTFASSFVAYVTLTTAVSESVLTKKKTTDAWINRWEDPMKS